MIIKRIKRRQKLSSVVVVVAVVLFISLGTLLFTAMISSKLILNEINDESKLLILHPMEKNDNKPLKIEYRNMDNADDVIKNTTKVTEVHSQEILHESIMKNDTTDLEVWSMPKPLETRNKIYLFPSPIPFPNATLGIRPLYGKHRWNSSQVIFSFAHGLGLGQLLPFLETLWNTGYNGDLVLGISYKLDRELQTYIKLTTQKHEGLVVYDIPLECTEIKIRKPCRTIGMFQSLEGKRKLDDRRGYREIAQLRFEYYWAWATLYSPEKSRIWLFDARDVSFQQHPFNKDILGSSSATTLHVFEESSRFKIRNQRSNRRWIKGGYGDSWFQHLASENIICSGTTFGGQSAIEWYTRAMVHQYDITNCTIYGCDQGHHNVLIRSHLLEGTKQITSIHIHPQGHGMVTTLGLLLENTTLRSLGLLLENGTIVNSEGRISPIVHQYDRDDEFRHIMEQRYNKKLQQWRKRPKI